MKILAVDDDKAARSVLVRMLKSGGYIVESAVNGKDALEKVSLSPPDLIITDILMPEMDGYALCRALKGDPKFKEIPVVVYSGTYINPADEDLALDMGAVRFLVKPLDVKTILKEIGEIMGEVKGGSGAASEVSTANNEELDKRYSRALARKLEEKVRELEEERNLLIESENRYRIVTDNISDVIWLIDESEHFIYVSPSMINLTGYTAEEIMQQKLEDTIAGGSLFRMAQARERRKEGYEGAIRMELEQLKKDGSSIWVETITRVLRDADGEKIGILGVSRDISERIKADLKLLEAHDKLIATLSAIPDMLFEVDQAGNIFTFYAPRPEDFFISPEKLLNSSVREVFPEGAAETVMEAIVSAAQDGLHRGATYSLDFPEGEEWFELSVALKDQPLAPDSHLIVLARNITERKQAEENLRLKEMERRIAEEANIAKDEFLASISHELRTPLTGIIGMVQTMERMIRLEKLTPKKQERMIANILQSSNLLADIIEEILDFTRIEAGRLEVNIEAVSVASVMETIYSTVETLASEKNLKFSVAVEKNLPMVSADTKRLSQIILNLLGNAVKFTDAGEIIFSAGKDETSQVLICIEDTGCGIDPGDLENIFERFVRVSCQSSRQGTGLGLAISKGLAGLIDAEIWAESIPGEGSKFFLRLKRWEEETVEG